MAAEDEFGKETLWYRARQALLAHVVQLVGGVLMVGFGIALGGGAGWQRVAGNVLVGVGGVLVTHATATVWATENALRDVRHRVGGVAKHVGTVCGQIGQALRDRQTQEEEEHTTLALVGSHVQELYGLMEDLEDISGTRFEGGSMLATVEKVTEFIARLEDITSRAVGGQVPEGELQNLRVQVEELAQGLQRVDTVERVETLGCPGCGNPVSFSIGLAAGSSAAPFCGTCATRFHAHRGPDASVFSRRWGGSQTTPRFTVVCPRCGQSEVRITGTDTEGDTTTRWCLACHSRLIIDSTDGAIVQVIEDEPAEGTIVESGLTTGTRMLECPSCKGIVRTFARRGDGFYAVCYQCNRLVRAPSPGA